MSPHPSIAHSPQLEEQDQSGLRPSRDLVLENAANELVIAVVGHVGSGTSEIAKALTELLENTTLPGGAYQANILKARKEIEDWAKENGEALPDGPANDLSSTHRLQDLGDLMRQRSNDASAVARALVRRIRATRAEKTGAAIEDDAPVKPDGKRRAYILDALRNPAEVYLLRHVYQDAFCLIGVVCEENVRLARLTEKYSNAGRTNAELFMKRDAKAASKFGQRVSDAFHLADFFVDNTTARTIEDGSGNAEWNISDHLSRLVKIVNHSEIVRPSTEETAMHHAYSASLRSACLSRQVGAALVDSAGNLVATGTNEVPRAGGGVYGEAFDTDHSSRAKDHRCAYRPLNGEPKPFCSSSREQTKLVQKLIEEIPELNSLNSIRKQALVQDIRQGGVGDILEFSRAVHAEMDALLSAAREGVSTLGTRLFVTTYPCHYCARHIVSAGIDEVQYIEPYPKSRATDLHSDAIQIRAPGWQPPSQGGKRVLFRPFVGVAPRMYRRAFLKDRELKDSVTGVFELGLPDWGSAWFLRAASYSELEAKLSSEGGTPDA